jgi:hypothetical protein
MTTESKSKSEGLFGKVLHLLLSCILTLMPKGQPIPTNLVLRHNFSGLSRFTIRSKEKWTV